MIYLLAGPESVVLSQQLAQMITLEKDKRTLQCAVPGCTQRAIPSQMFALAEPPTSAGHRIHVLCKQHHAIAVALPSIAKDNMVPLLEAISAALRAERSR